MPILNLDGTQIRYQVDDFAPPWESRETVLMLHGIAESSDAWFGWMPHFAGRYRVVRPDMRGFGRSYPVPADFPWTLGIMVDDALGVMDALGIDRFHVIGAKIGGTIGRAMAARHPQRVNSLTAVGTPLAFRPEDEARLPEWLAGFARDGVEPWARQSMASRLGRDFPASGIDWWVQYMGRTPRSTQISFIRTIYTSAEFRAAAIAEELPRISAPTLVITTADCGIATIADTRAWQEKIRDSELLVLPGDSYHVAASDPHRCAAAALEFIARRAGGAASG